MKIKNDFDENKIPFSQAFPNYTLEMWRGNAPAHKGRQYLKQDGTIVECDVWQTRFGGGESVDGYLEFAQFSLNQKVSVYILGGSVIVDDIRYAGQSDLWQYTNNPAYVSTGGRVHQLQQERLEQYLSAQVQDCLLWRMIQERTKEMIGLPR